MGAKHVCFTCRQAFNVPYAAVGPTKCPSCAGALTILPHRFRPPKKREDEKWATAQYLVKQGFRYDHISPIEDAMKRSGAPANYVPYPETLREAREFVQQHRALAKKS